MLQNYEGWAWFQRINMRTLPHHSFAEVGGPWMGVVYCTYFHFFHEAKKKDKIIANKDVHYHYYYWIIIC